MNADAFRHLYAYHFHENRQLWDQGLIAVSDAQFTQPIAYSIGSLKHQVVHLMSVDAVWFSDLRGEIIADALFQPDDYTDRPAIRAHWDRIEQDMRVYLGALRDEMLFTQPLSGEDAQLYLWQVLFHVINHGTDHRAQILRLLHDLGVKTGPQDYVFYAYEHPPSWS